MKASDLKRGNALEMDNQLWIVTELDHVKPGKGPAYIQAKLRGVLSGGVQEKRLRSTEEVNQVNLDRREIEYLYTDASGAVFMDNETYDQIPVPLETLGSDADYLAPNLQVTGLFYEGNCITVELPSAVEVTVVETPPGIKDATKTNQLKEATCDTGLKTRVPPFISEGERIKVSTSTGEYLGRSSGD